MGGAQSKRADQPPSTAAAAPSQPPPSKQQEIPTNASGMAQAATGGGGCPVKIDGSGGMGFRSLFRGRNPHLPGKDSNPGLPTEAAAPSNPEGGSGGGCPVKGGKKGMEYNVYSQPIDPANNMPSASNQLPAPGQNESLSTDRKSSTIPKGGSEGGTTWTYPSPQMFYNALARKNKLGDTTEEDISPVVALHNNMNEKTWSKVLEWEAVLDPEGGRSAATEDGGPKLLKFMGRPSDLSPKARFKNWFLGHPLPFDRHDWTVVRGDGTEVRYVIDYYHDESRAKETEGSGMPEMHDRDAVGSILVDVRPALDGLSAAMGRAVTMPYARRIGQSTRFEPLPMSPTIEMKDQVAESVKVWDNIQENAREGKEAERYQSEPKIIKVAREEDEGGVSADVRIGAKEAAEIAKSFAQALGDCRDAQRAVDSCEDESDYARASLDLTMCMGKLLCPLQHAAVAKTIADEPSDPNDAKEAEVYDARIDAALENIAICVAASNEKAAMARSVHPDAFNY